MRLRRWREYAGVVFAAGLRPCAGALILLVFAASQGLIGAGIGAVFAMALGTALTTSIIALSAVFMKEVALRAAGGRARYAPLAGGVVELAGGRLRPSRGLCAAHRLSGCRRFLTRPRRFYGDRPRAFDTNHAVWP